MHHHRRTGAIGGFRHALACTALCEESGMRIAKHSGDRDIHTEQGGVDRSEQGIGIEYLGHHGTIESEQFQQFIVPLQGVDIEQLCPARVGVIGGMHTACGQLPHQIGIYRTEQQPPVREQLLGNGYMLQYPRGFRRREKP